MGEKKRLFKRQEDKNVDVNVEELEKEGNNRLDSVEKILVIYTHMTRHRSKACTCNGLVRKAAVNDAHIVQVRANSRIEYISVLNNFPGS